jgi:hypothetical protein
MRLLHGLVNSGTMTQFTAIFVEVIETRYTLLHRNCLTLNMVKGLLSRDLNENEGVRR